MLKSLVPPIFTSSLQTDQLEELKRIVAKRMQDDDYNLDNFRLTSTDRQVDCWEHQHLVTALDNLNSYQQGRRMQACTVGSVRFGRSTRYDADPRTKIVELLKLWLRTHVNRDPLTENEVRRVYDLCGDVLHKPRLFPARNATSFMHVIANVKSLLEQQLTDVLSRDRTCAELAKQVLKLGRNLISDALAFLLLAPTDLRHTDSLPSTEVVQLWQSLPDEGHPFPRRADKRLQKAMAEAWQTQVGMLLAAVLSTPFCVSLFFSVGAEEEAPDRHAAESMSGEGTMGSEPRPATGGGAWLSSVAGTMARGAQAVVGRRSGHEEASPGGTALAAAPQGFRPRLELARATFQRSDFGSSGLCGALRLQTMARTRAAYLAALQALFELSYMLGEAFVHFRGIGDTLGDYGMITAAPWLHPFLEVLVEKVKQLKGHSEQVYKDVERMYVDHRATGDRIEKPAPSEKMLDRSRTCFQRAFSEGEGGHHKALLKAIDSLRDRSNTSRLQGVFAKLDADVTSLQTTLASQEFRECTGERVAFPGFPTGAADAARPDPRHEAVPALRDAEAQPASASAIRADVVRLAASKLGRGLVPHDRRRVVVNGAKMYVFEPGSLERIKLELDVKRDVADSQLNSEHQLKLVLRRPVAGEAETQQKEYVFEFPTQNLARDFHDYLWRAMNAAHAAE